MWRALSQFLGIGNRMCRYCGLTGVKGDMCRDKKHGWFCDMTELKRWVKWEDHRTSCV